MEEFKDKYIKNRIKQDVEISDKANDVFEKFKFQEDKKVTNKSYLGLNRFLTVAASFLLVILLGMVATMVYEKSENENIEIFESMVKGNKKEVYVENEQKVKTSEGEYVTATLTPDNTVTIKLKPKAITEFNLKEDSEEEFEISGITSNVTNILAGALGKKESQYLFLLLENGKVEYIDVLTKNNGLNLKNQGWVKDSYNVKGFVQRTEHIVNSTELYYTINTYVNSGDMYRIDFDSNNNVITCGGEKVRLMSQDGEKVYSISPSNGEYFFASGWAGGSNNVYYRNYGTVFHIELTNGTNTRLIQGVKKLYKKDDTGLEVDLEKEYIVLNVDTYLKMNDFEGNRVEKGERLIDEETSNQIDVIDSNIDSIKIEQAIKTALIENIGKNLDEYISYREFTWGEAHKLLKAEMKEGKIYAYVAAQVGTYELENEKVKIKSCMAGPFMIVFNIDESDNYVFEKYVKPEDGMNWSNSIREIFPSDIVNQAFNVNYSSDFYQNQIKSYLIK